MLIPAVAAGQYNKTLMDKLKDRMAANSPKGKFGQPGTLW